MISVAIDGPAGAGKSTLARRLAADFGYIYVDTGAMFRTIGLYALRAGKEPKDNEAVDALLPNITLEFAFIEGEQHIYLNGEDVSTAIRTEEVGMAASAVGDNPAVRAFLLDMQRDMAREQDVLMDGRDIGTVVFPDAELKIFMTADPRVRACRRYDELRAKGVSIVYISHKMDEILRISDEVTIMRDGQYIGTWEAKELTTDMIITKMVGRELSNLYPPRSNTPGEVVFEVKDFTSINPKSFRHVNFNVRKGEILGVAGLVGAQRTELMEGLFGLRCHTSGTITYKGKELTINQPQDAIKNGIAMLTEDRRATGILGVLSIADNVSIASPVSYTHLTLPTIA